MTEEEAKNKWCPMSRIIAIKNRETDEPGYGPYNRWEDSCDEKNGMLPRGSYCLASECMMWIWEKDSSSNGRCGLIR